MKVLLFPETLINYGHNRYQNLLQSNAKKISVSLRLAESVHVSRKEHLVCSARFFHAQEGGVVFYTLLLLLLLLNTLQL